MTGRRALGRAMPVLVLAVLLAIWEVGCTVFAVPDFVLPRPSRVIATLISTFGPIWFHASHTLLTTAAGFALAVVVGCCSASWSGLRRLPIRGCIRC